MFNWFKKRNERKLRIEEIANNNALNKSEKMRRLFDLGMDITNIANLIGVRYNFVYNVVMDYIRVNSSKQTNAEATPSTKKQEIIKLYEQGQPMTQISKTLSTDYNYVTRVVKEYKRLVNHA